MKTRNVLIATGLLLLIVTARVLKPNEETGKTLAGLESKEAHDYDSAFPRPKWVKAELKEARDTRRRNVRNPEDVKLTGPEIHEAAVGENVTLDCHLEPQADVRERWDRIVIEWKFNDKDYVLVYRARGVANSEQADQFRPRVSPDISWDLTKGILAVTISSVTKKDAGNYSCSVGHGSKRVHFSTQLRIKDSAPTGNPQKNRARDQTTPNHSQKSTAGALVLLVLAASTLLYSLCY